MIYLKMAERGRFLSGVYGLLYTWRRIEGGKLSNLLNSKHLDVRFSNESLIIMIEEMLWFWFNCFDGFCSGGTNASALIMTEDLGRNKKGGDEFSWENIINSTCRRS